MRAAAGPPQPLGHCGFLASSTDLSEPLRIGVAGLGTVGAATVALLDAQADMLERRCGRRLQVAAVSARDRSRDRGLDLGGITWAEDAVALARDPQVDVVVELIGGADGIAKAVSEAAIGDGKHVVTANKALLAMHGNALAAAAERVGVHLGYEAAVAGGIPVVKALREALAGNRFQRVHGILNGTCNYILTTMQETGRSFDDVLREAQEHGYAEADPSFDVDGIDTAHKLAILASLAYGCEMNFGAVHVQGIRHVSPLDIQFAAELGYRIKLLGSARITAHGLEQRVHPCMIPETAPIATVGGVLNAVVAEGDYVGTVVLEGRGAGAGPTASAVVGDIVDIALGRSAPTFGVPSAMLERLPSAPMERHFGAYYLRMMVADLPGVFADIAGCLRDAGVSIESALQRGRDPGETVPLVLTIHETEEAAMIDALQRIGRLSSVHEPPCMIRIESL
jgi:homoserine dehydrogenase